MTPEQRGRLERLATYLEGMPAERFHFGSWANDKDLSACGTTACAIGWATAIPEFANAGLHLREDASGWIYPALGNWNGPVTESLGHLCGELFGLSPYHAELLFLPNERDPDDEDEDPYDGEQLSPYASAREVAAHIREYLASEQSGEGKP